MEHGFNMLENASDKSLKRLSERRVLTEKEKERMLKMSMDKLNKMNNNTEDELQVSGVERYKRPKWYGFATAAASLLLVGGIVGGGIYLSRNGQTPDDPMTEVTTTSETTVATEEYDFSAEVSQLEADMEDMLRNEPHAVADSLMMKLNQFVNLTIGWNVGEDKQVKKKLETSSGTVEYYRCYDFDKPEDVKAKYREYFTESFLNRYEYLWNEHVVENPIFKVFDGKLYHRSENIDAVLYSYTQNDIKINSFDETSFNFTVACRTKDDNQHLLNIVCVKESDEWKIDSYSDRLISDDIPE
ncbi:MAG: hypothetical protein J6U16_04385 [Ruminococcus sp.]|nr:hypothetical protein [Ruminococcus sp.]